MKKLRKYWIATLTFTLMAIGANAQISGGIVGGVGTGSVRISDLDSGAVNVIEGRNIHGYSLGVYGRGNFGPFYVRPELAYNFRSGHVKQNSAESNFRLHKFEVPVMFGFQFLGPLSIEAGPVYNYVLQVSDRYNERDVDLMRSGLGYRVGAGLNFDRVFFNLGYQGVTYKASESSGKTTFKEPYKLTFNIGIRLGGGG